MGIFRVVNVKHIIAERVLHVLSVVAGDHDDRISSCYPRGIDGVPGHEFPVNFDQQLVECAHAPGLTGREDDRGKTGRGLFVAMSAWRGRGTGQGTGGYFLHQAANAHPHDMRAVDGDIRHQTFQNEIITAGTGRPC